MPWNSWYYNYFNKINIIHNQLHKENHNFLLKIADNYSSQEQDIIIKFIKDLKNNNKQF